MARLLVVEDEPVAGRLIIDVLLASGHAAGLIGSAEQALEVMCRRAPDCAIVDCGLPGVSGVELVRAMRNHPVLCGVPVVMLTARQSERDEDLAIGAGAQDYLRKPVDPDQLLGRIDALLMRGQARQSVSPSPRAAFR